MPEKPVPANPPSSGVSDAPKTIVAELLYPPGSTNYHLCLDVRGALHNWTAHDLATCFLHDDGRRMTAREAKDILLDEVAKGHKVIPCAPCDNFSYETGCQGHRSVTQSQPTEPKPGTASQEKR